MSLLKRLSVYLLGRGEPDGTKVLFGDGWWRVPSASGGPATQIQESSGPTTLSIGAIADGEFAKRVGSALVGAATVRGTTGGHVSGGGGLARWYEAGRVGATAGTAASHSANVLRAIPFRAPARGCTIDQIAFNVTSAVAASNARVGAYRATSESNI